MTLGRAYCDTPPPVCVGNGIYFDYIEDGNFVGSSFAMTTTVQGEAYLKLVRQANVYTGYVSLDGTNWTVVGTRTVAITPTKVGLKASNQIEGAGEIPADFDFFTLIDTSHRTYLPVIVKNSSGSPIGQTVYHSPTDENPYSFYSYFPASAVQEQNIVITVWPHGGNMFSDDYSYHEEQALNSLSRLTGFAEEYQTPVIVVAIPRVMELYVHSLHPETFTTDQEMLRRPDLKLIQAVWDQYIPAMRQAGFDIEDRIFMMGFSSAGMFVHRFTMLHPERIKAVWLGGEAPAPLPASEFDGQFLTYPLGMGDIEALAGKPFDFETYRTIPHFVMVGSQDVNPNNDTTTYTDIFTEEQRLFIRSRFGDTNPERIRFFHDYLVSVGVPSQFKEYDLGHQTNNQVFSDAFDFLATYMND